MNYEAYTNIMRSTFKPNYTCELYSKKKYLPTFCSSWQTTTTYDSTKTYAQRFTPCPYLAQCEMLMLPKDNSTYKIVRFIIVA